MNPADHTGPAAFGPAYRFMLENEAHAEGSVDRDIVRGIVRLCPETAEHLYRDHTPLEIGYRPGSRPVLEAIVSEHVTAGASREAGVRAIAGFTRGLGLNAEQDLEKMRFGGTEEQIIQRGSDWCTDVARVACALYQVAGFPSRIVDLFDLDAAYSGHVIVEVYRGGFWGAVDSSSGVVYRHPEGAPASTWELMNDSKLIESHAGPEAWYTSVNQFKAAGITDYFVRDHGRYDYAVSGVNDYYRSILEKADQGWPGGLRWLHGEDAIVDSARP
jgi:transglutaminase-like putative cysteine protease